jgi:multidrug efflux pump subunit AcrA (membrane-fusion protein)
MSETQDISNEQTIPAMPSVTSSFPLDLGSLFDSDPDDLDLTPLPKSARPGRKRRIWIPILIVGLLIILIGGGILTYINLNGTPPVQYIQSAATVGNLAVTVSGTGPVQPNAVYDLNFATSAPIQAIYVKVGDQVTQGQKLAEVNPTTLQDAVTQAQDSVNSAQTSVNNASTSLGNTENQQGTSLNIAYINEQNALKACASGGSSGGGGASATPTPTPDPTTVANCKNLAKDQYAQSQEQANSSINSASNQVASAEQQLTNAQAALQTAKDNLQNATLVAPHAGVVESINGLVGENPGGGSSGGSGSSNSSSAFLVLVDNSSLDVAAQINEANIASVAVNQPAQFTVSAYPSKTFLASVSSVDTMGVTSSNVVTYLVNLAVNMQSIGTEHVYPGMTATVNITTAERISTLLIPSSALTYSTTALQNGELTRSALSTLVSGNTGSTTTGSRGIVVELKNGKLVPVLVTTGLTNGQYTEILSGLQEGDKVVTSQTGGQSTSSTTTSSSTRGTGGFGGGTGGGGGFGGGGFGGRGTGNGG